MNLTDILSSIDAEIATLQQVRVLLAGGNGHVKTSTSNAVKAKRTMSAEGRARIAVAQKKRWAKTKRAAKKAAA